MSDYQDCTTFDAAVALDRDSALENARGGDLVFPPQPGTVDLPELPQDCGIRETLLWRFRDPEDEAALRRLGDMLTELVDESGQFGPEGSDGGNGRRGDQKLSLPREELRAVALDLFYSARHLSEVAAERFASELTGPEIRLTEQSEEWAAHVTVVAASIWEVVRPGDPS